MASTKLCFGNYWKRNCINYHDHWAFVILPTHNRHHREDLYHTFPKSQVESTALNHKCSAFNIINKFKSFNKLPSNLVSTHSSYNIIFHNAHSHNFPHALQLLFMEHEQYSLVFPLQTTSTEAIMRCIRPQIFTLQKHDAFLTLELRNHSIYAFVFKIMSKMLILFFLLRTWNQIFRMVYFHSVNLLHFWHVWDS